MGNLPESVGITIRDDSPAPWWLGEEEVPLARTSKFLVSKRLCRY